MKKSIILFILFMLLSSGVVFAAQEFIFQDKGIDIEYPKIENVRVKENFTFQFHTFNASDGLPFLNLNCSFHLYNSYGDHILVNNSLSIDNNRDWEIKVNGLSNFSNIGDYYYIFQCNNSIIGGFASEHFLVSSARVTLKTPEAVLYAILTFVVFLLFLLCLYINIIIPFANKTNEKNETVYITKWKYLKIGMVLITYGLAVWLFNLLLGISNNFLVLSMFYGFFSFIFTALIKLTIPVFVIVVVLFGGHWIRDRLKQIDIDKFGVSKR